MNNLAIVKLGGAAITDKQAEFTMRPEVIRQAMQELTTWEDDLVIIHGAGSFAHNLAKHYDLRDGFSGNQNLMEQLEGVSKIRTSLQQLHLRVLEEANQMGLQTFSVPVSSTVITEGETEYDRYFLDAVHHALELGLVPVLYGDMVFDTQSKFRVMSGDRIIRLLCEELNYDDVTVIFGTDVDGLYTRHPREPGAEMIPGVDLSELDQVIENSGGSSGTDVTGGMRGKLIEVKHITDLFIDVYLVNLTIPGRLGSLLNGEKTVCTHFNPRAREE